MLYHPPMIEFLELRACSIESKVVTPSNGARAAIANLEYSGKTENELWFLASGTW